jgi:DNA-binding NarL/FixJ family response regulator
MGDSVVHLQEWSAPPRVLIADDDPVVRSLLSRSLAVRYEVVAVAGDAEEAVERAKATRPDVAVIDVHMPGGGGRRAIQGITESCPGTAIVILSGDGAEEVVREHVDAGAAVYVRKGVGAEELGATIDRAIRAQRAYRRAAGG